MNEEEEARYNAGYTQGRSERPREDIDIFYCRGYVAALLSRGWDKVAERSK